MRDYAVQMMEEKNENEQNLREMWDTIKHTNVHIIQVPQERRERNRKKY